MKFFHHLALAGIIFLLFETFSISPSFAFDCTKATTKTELAICANSELVDADDNMGRAYSDLRNLLGVDGAKQVKISQRQWLKYREFQCEAEMRCIFEETNNRLERLINLAKTPLPMIPIFYFQPGSQDSYKIKIEGVKFADPITAGQQLFNREIDKIIASAPVDEKTDEQTVGPWEQEIFMEVTRITPRMISATVTTYDYSGGAHPNSWSSGVNVNLENAKKLETTKQFSTNAIQSLLSICTDKIVAEKSERFSGEDYTASKLEEDYPGEINKHIMDMNTWKFDKDGATVRFNSYEVGSYADGPFECEISTSLLNQLSNDPDLLTR